MTFVLPAAHAAKRPPSVVIFTVICCDIEHFCRYARPWDSFQPSPVSTNTNATSSSGSQENGTAKSVPRTKVEPVVVSNDSVPGARVVDSGVQGESANVLSNPSDNAAPLLKAASTAGQDKVVAAVAAELDDATAPIHVATKAASAGGTVNAPP